MTRTDDKEAVRLNRFLAMVGIAARRECDQIIAAGRVTVDGHRVTSPAVRVVPGVSRVSVDKTPIEKPTRPIVLILNKPTGVVSTASDPEGRPTVVDLCRGYGKRRRLFPVGRLDVNTTGLLLLTNDGMLCYRLTHPRFQIPRTYHVRVRGLVDPRRMTRLARQLTVPGEAPRHRRASKRSTSGPARSSPGSSVELIKEMGRESILKIVLHEGRNRQVRRMCEAVGLRVVKLKRVRFGPLSVRGLPLGAVRPLEPKELDKIYRLTA